MIKTRFTELVGIGPIVQGGMMWVGRAELAAAVSNAGGLGILPGAHAADAGRSTQRSIAAGDDRQTVRREPHDSAVDGAPPYGALSTPSSTAGIRIVETAGHSPKHVLPAQGDGIIVIHKCTSVRQACRPNGRRHAISIDGFECAGHPGEDDIPGLVLLPAADRVIKIPMIASGGFGDGRGLVAALALGAEGINMGTRFWRLSQRRSTTR